MCGSIHCKPLFRETYNLGSLLVCCVASNSMFLLVGVFAGKVRFRSINSQFLNHNKLVYEMDLRCLHTKSQITDHNIIEVNWSKRA